MQGQNVWLNIDVNAMLSIYYFYCIEVPLLVLTQCFYTDVVYLVKKFIRDYFIFKNTVNNDNQKINKNKTKESSE